MVALVIVSEEICLLDGHEDIIAEVEDCEDFEDVKEDNVLLHRIKLLPLLSSYVVLRSVNQQRTDAVNIQPKGVIFITRVPKYIAFNSAKIPNKEV